MTANATNRPLPNAEQRSVTQVHRGVQTSDGAGVKLTRVIGSAQLNMLDPFLLLDVFESENPDDYIGGFPPHPHRGFETVTYLLEGRMRHEDNAGNSGVIQTGGAQWMTAGKGVIHSEMPEQVSGLLKGVQLWINLPARLKGIDPGYRDVTARQIPAEQGDGVNIKVLAGTTNIGTQGPLHAEATEPYFLDVCLDNKATFAQNLPYAHAAFIFVLDGELDVPGNAPSPSIRIAQGEIGVLSEGVRVTAKATGNGTRFLLLAARALGEPVARGGPFVMNTREEIRQAFDDYASGAFGPNPWAGKRA